MELNNITNTGTWSEQSTRLNDNFNKVALGIDTLQSAYQSLSQSAPEVVATLPQTGKANKIYRLVGTTSYSDYMYNADDLTTPILMATYDNAIDNVPVVGSDNLVKSGGTWDSIFIPQIPNSRVEIFRKKSYNNSGVMIDYDDCDIYRITLTGNEHNITALNKATIGSTSYRLDWLFVFLDSNNNVLSHAGGTNQEIGMFITKEIPSNASKVDVTVWKANAFENKVLFNLNMTIDESLNIESFNPVTNNAIIKNYLVKGARPSDVSLVIGKGYNASGIPINHDKFFLTFINLYGDEKYISALNLITVNANPPFTEYNATPLFVFYDSSDSIISIYNGAVEDTGKIVKCAIPSGAAKVGVNCAINQVKTNENLITLTRCNKVLNVLGDSITEQRYYTNALEKMGYTINNYGISGTTISTVRQSNYFKSRVSSMTDNCDVVIVFGGINDWQLGAPLGEKFETTDESKFYPALNELFITLKNKYVSKPIYVCTPLHTQFHLEGYADKMEYTENNNQITANSYGNGDILSKYVQAIKDVAQLYSIQVIDLYSESGLAALIPSNNTVYYNDGLHPNAAGGILIAKCIDKYLSM